MAVCVSLLVSASALPQGLPHLGGDEGLSLAAERRLGDRIVRELYRDPDWIDDPILYEYVDEVWQGLRKAARLRGDSGDELDGRMAWRVWLSRDRSVNAFALPGGYFGVHLGLLGLVGNRDELAAVLAHEMSHVTQRHIARMQSQQARQTPLLLGAMILGALAAAKSPDAANAAIVGSQAVAAQAQLNYSRDMEREADRVGFGLMTDAGFAPEAAATMFDKLYQANRHNDRGAFPYLRTHPLTTERLADMSLRVPKASGMDQPVSDASLRHAMINARARVLSGTVADDVGDYQAAARARDGRAMALDRQAGIHYGAALQFLRARGFDAADRELAEALRILPDKYPKARRLLRLLQAEVDIARESWPAVIERLGAAALDGSPPRPELLAGAYARLRIADGRAVPVVVDALQTHVANDPGDSAAWALLAQSYRLLSRPLAALRCDAEARLALLDLQGAREHLRAAQDLIRSGSAGRSGAEAIEAAIIATRSREIDSRLREQALER